MPKVLVKALPINVEGARCSVTEDDKPIAPLEFYIDPGSASAEDIAKLFSAMSDLYRALGGVGLEFDTESKPIGDQC